MIKTLAKNIKGFVKESVLTPFFMILEVIVETIIPFLMSSMIDDGINKGDMQHIFITGGYMGALALTGLFAGMMGGIYGAKASAGFARNLRRSMFANIQSFSFANIDRYSTAGLVTRMTTDVTNLQNAYQMLLRMCFRAPVSLICAMAMTFIINARLACIYLIATILLSVVLAFIMKATYKYFSQVFEKYDELNASVQENVTSIRVVKAFVREKHEVGKFRKAADNVYRLFVKAENAMVTVSPIMMVTSYASIILVSWFGANMIVSSELTTGELTSMLTYCMNILMNLLMVAMVFVMLTMSLASGKRVAGVLNEKSTLANPENPVYEVKDGSIEFDNVSFSYNTKAEKPILNDINLKIKSGETIGIIGGTGSSKTSLVNLIARLYDVTEGSVKVGGKDVRDYDIETLRDKVSVVLQSNVLFSGTILDNLRWGNENATEEECVMPASWRVQMRLSKASLISTTQKSNRAVLMFRAVRNSVFALQELC